MQQEDDRLGQRRRPAVGKFDMATVVVALLSLLAAWPFLVRGSLANNRSDTALHVLRTAEFAYGLRAGDLYPRWAPDFYYGYGYPVFNFYAPLACYVASLASLANPERAVVGTKAVFVLSFVTGGLGMFWLMRRKAGASAGVVAAAAFLFAPYVFLIDPHVRGALPELLAIGLSPMLLWALTAFADERDRRHLVLASLLVAATLLAHNLIGPTMVLLAAGNLAWRRLFERTPRSRDRWWTPGRDVLPLAIGVALSAFFWLPVVLERHTVQLYRLTGAEHFRYRNHFLSIGELLGPSFTLDRGAENPRVRFNLGVAQYLLAAAGLGLLLLRERGSAEPADRGSEASRRHHVANASFWGLGLLSFCFLMTRFSKLLWDAVPPAAFWLFPWRLLGPASLCAAVLAGYSSFLTQLLPRGLRQWGLALLVAAPMLSAAPVFFPPDWGDFGPTDRRAIADFERRNLAVGTTAAGEYLPTAVRVLPEAHAAADAIDPSGLMTDRLERRTIPSGASVTALVQDRLREEYLITSPQEFDLSLRRFMFAGWRGEIDENRAELRARPGDGLMVASIPAGQHRLTVWMGTTGARSAGWILTAAGLIGLLVVGRHLCPTAGAERPADDSLGVPALLTLGLSVVGVSLGSGLGLFQPYSRGLEVLPAQHAFHRRFDEGIDLLGYDLERSDAHPGEAVGLVLYWKARQRVDKDFRVFVHLADDAGRIWAQADKIHPADFPTSRWPSNLYVRDVCEFRLPVDIPAGRYRVCVGLWDGLTGVRQSVTDPAGAAVGDAVCWSALVNVTKV